MMDRRAFLKLSAGALALAAAGALTGCSSQVEDGSHATVSVGNVDFTCATPFTSGGGGRQLTYRTEFTILNKSSETVTIAPEDINCIFHDTDGTEQTLKFKSKPLTAAPYQKAVYTGSLQFYLETENGVEEKFDTGTYELRVKYGEKTIVFFSNRTTVTGHIV